MSLGRQGGILSADEPHIRDSCGPTPLEHPQGDGGTPGENNSVGSRSSYSDSSLSTAGKRRVCMNNGWHDSDGEGPGYGLGL